ncbi:hypothetical protein ACFYUJ_29890 [Streptomyces sp. NPDC004520]|uniref:hypothetical protein n=1 Tax=Streptomyces sp. NPDC004520 TaxID=3364702 RepID=UPI0036739681
MDHEQPGWAVTDADGRYGDPTPDPAKPLTSWRYEPEADGDGTRLRQPAALGPHRSGVALAVEHWPDREEELVAYRVKDTKNLLVSCSPKNLGFFWPSPPRRAGRHCAGRPGP